VKLVLSILSTTKGKEPTHEKKKKNDAKFVMSMTSNFYANFLFDFDEVFISRIYGREST
jgi:hypothetical protein